MANHRHWKFGEILNQEHALSRNAEDTLGFDIDSSVSSVPTFAS